MYKISGVFALILILGMCLGAFFFQHFIAKTPNYMDAALCSWSYLWALFLLKLCSDKTS